MSDRLKRSSPSDARASGESDVEALRSLLIEAACARTTVTYGEVARRVFGGRVSARSTTLMRLLAEVDRQEEERTGVWIATLVVRADTGRPGDGYFAFAADAGRDITDREALWRGEAEKVWATYQKEGCA